MSQFGRQLVKVCLAVASVTIVHGVSAQEVQDLEKYNDFTSGGVNMLDGLPQWREVDLAVDTESPVPITISRHLILNPRFPTGSGSTFATGFAADFKPLAEYWPRSARHGHGLTFQWAGSRIVFDRQSETDPWENHYKSGETVVDQGGQLVLTLKDGGTVTFQSASPSSYMGTKYQAPNGDFLIFDWEPRINSAGRLTYDLKRIQNSRGHGVSFSFEPNSSRILRVDAIRTYCEVTIYQSCATAQLPHAEYEYTSSGGYLSKSINSGGLAHSYQYHSSGHGLTRVVQDGPPSSNLITFEWRFSEDGDPISVIATTDAQGNRSLYRTGPTSRRTFPDGGEIEAGYPGRIESPAAVQVRGGAVEWHGLVRNPQPLRLKDQLGRTTSYGYDLRGRLIRTRKGGVLVEYTLDERGNKISETVTPSDLSNPQSMTQTWSFAPCTQSNLKSCNKPASAIDALGNETSFTYDPLHGGVVTQTGPAVDGIRPQTRYTYTSRLAYYEDGQGQMVAAASPIWLLAQEEYCRTSAADMYGNCASGASDKVITEYEYSNPNPSGPSNVVLVGIAIIADGQTLRTCYRYDINGRKIAETQAKAGLVSCQ